MQENCRRRLLRPGLLACSHPRIRHPGGWPRTCMMGGDEKAGKFRVWRQVRHLRSLAEAAAGEQAICRKPVSGAVIAAPLEAQFGPSCWLFLDEPNTAARTMAALPCQAGTCSSTASGTAPASSCFTLSAMESEKKISHADKSDQCQPDPQNRT